MNQAEREAKERDLIRMLLRFSETPEAALARAKQYSESEFCGAVSGFAMVIDLLVAGR